MYKNKISYSNRSFAVRDNYGFEFMTIMSLSRPSLIVKNPATLHTGNAPTPCKKSCHHSWSVCSKLEKGDTPKQRDFERVVCFYFLQDSGLERAVLVTKYGDASNPNWSLRVL
jgi:hypothetical protein